MNLINIFSIPIVEEYLNLDLQYLKEYSLNMEKESEGRVFSNYGGWQSHDLDLKDPIIITLSNHVLKCASAFYETMSLKAPANLILSNMWINVNRKGSFNRSHIHSKSFISGVYYIECPAKCGELCFQNPSNFDYTINTDSDFVSFNEYNSMTYRVIPEVNKLILFGSHLEHYVEPNSTDDPRISISFNINYEIV